MTGHRAGVAQRAPMLSAGFTLIEVLVSMALTVVLVSALMHLATASARDQQRLLEHSADQPPVWFDPLVRQIEQDLLMATGMSLVVEPQGPDTEARLYLVTCNASPHTSPRGGRGISHEPVRVLYRLVDTEFGGLLLRDQHPLSTIDVAAGGVHARSDVQVVAVGIERVQIAGSVLKLGARPLPTPTRDRDRDRERALATVLDHGRPVQLYRVPSEVYIGVSLAHATRTGLGGEAETVRTYERSVLVR